MATKKLNGTVIVTYRCNARCTMCNRYKAPSKPEEEISLETIRKLPPMYFTNITGGEPFIRTDLKDIVRELRKKSDRIVISTNGFFTDRILDLCREFPDIGIRISIEGLEQTNNEIRGLADGYNRGYTTLKKLREMGMKDVGFGMTVQDKNAPDLVPLYRLSDEMGMEFATATLHNSFYFVEAKNIIHDRPMVAKNFEALINELLRSKQSDLTLMESKLIRLAVSQIMKGDKDLRTYKVNVSQLAEFLEVPKTNVYRSMQDINISLMQRVIFIRDKEVPDKKGKPNYKILHWLSSVEYKDGTLTYRLSDELKPYLIGLSEMFTLYSYDSIIKLPTNYSIRLFELLTSWVNIIIKGENTPAFPDISTDPDTGDVLLRITDDGVGMPPEQVAHLLDEPAEGAEKAEKFRHVGLWNVNRRIRYSFGEGYGLTIESEEDVGTEVTIRLPYQQKGDTHAADITGG